MLRKIATFILFIVIALSYAYFFMIKKGLAQDNYYLIALPFLMTLFLFYKAQIMEMIGLSYNFRNVFLYSTVLIFLIAFSLIRVTAEGFALDTTGIIFLLIVSIFLGFTYSLRLLKKGKT